VQKGPSIDYAPQNILLLFSVPAAGRKLSIWSYFLVVCEEVMPSIVVVAVGGKLRGFMRKNA